MSIGRTADQDLSWPCSGRAEAGWSIVAGCTTDKFGIVVLIDLPAVRER
jgi:hypothetical protein